MSRSRSRTRSDVQRRDVGSEHLRLEYVSMKLIHLHPSPAGLTRGSIFFARGWIAGSSPAIRWKDQSKMRMLWQNAAARKLRRDVGGGGKSCRTTCCSTQ